MCFEFICCCSKMRENYATHELNKTTWDMPEGYQNLNPVGSGAYGQVKAVQFIKINQGLNVLSIYVYIYIYSFIYDLLRCVVQTTEELF